MRRFAIAAAGLLLLPALLLFSFGRADEKSAPTPRKIDTFTLNDVDGKEWSLGALKEKKAIVVVFIGLECPISNAYAPVLTELEKKYAKDVQFVAINSNALDTPAKIKGHAKEHKIEFPVLKDTANVVADKFGARRTPEAFILSPSGEVLYQGRIDDQFGIGYKREGPTRRDLAEALDEVLAGKAVSKAKTDVAGCLISRAVKPKETGTITYTKHVSRIMQKNCQECHRPEQVGPMSLLTYEDAVAWSGMIQEVVTDKRMPPWYADPQHGKFSNDRTLSKEDRENLLGWIEQGCPKGEAADMPPAKEFAKGWTIGKPDVVFTMDKEYTVPSKTEKKSIAYQPFFVKTNFEEDRWIQAAEVRPGNRAVVHHIIVYVIGDFKTFEQERKKDPIGTGFLAAYAPGDLPLVCPEGTAKKVPKGAILGFQMHYTPTGTEEKDRSSIGLIFAKQPPKYEVKTRAIRQNKFEIPSGADNYEVKSQSTFDKDTELLSLLPHMHLRGKDFVYEVTYPDGKKETLLSVPKYDFSWQSNYRLEKPLQLPKGTRIDCTAHFDNSDKNRNNPDPTKAVRWGEQTWEEMMIGFVDYVVPVEADKKPDEKK
jgi:thiol-disulfide isomerase/thioredoxin